jgi:hypothetical protein
MGPYRRHQKPLAKISQIYLLRKMRERGVQGLGLKELVVVMEMEMLQIE